MNTNCSAKGNYLIDTDETRRSVLMMRLLIINELDESLDQARLAIPDALS